MEEMLAEPSAAIVHRPEAIQPQRPGRVISQIKMEARRSMRFHIKWRSAVVLATDQKATYHGWLKAISTTGTAIFSGHAIPLNPRAAFHIEIPAIHIPQARILTLTVRLVYCVYDGSASQFRTGVEFIDFPSNERAFLDNYLKKHCLPKLR